MLSYDPVAAAVTSTRSEQLPFGPITPPLMSKVSVVSAAIGFQVPPQLELAFGVAATSTPAGRSSTKL